MDSKWCFFVLLFLSFNSRVSESFRWTKNQQSSRILNAQIGSDVSLPCEFILTSEEESAMQQFNLIYWSRETPAGSQSWQGIASLTNLISNSEPRIIYKDKSRIMMNNKSLTILSVKQEDDALYQCEVKSSFYTTPTVIKLNVLTEIKKSKSELHSSGSLSSGASAGIGVSITLLVIAVLILGIFLLKSFVKRRPRPYVVNESGVSTNMTSIQRISGDNVAEAYLGPAAFHGSETDINKAVNNAYGTSPYPVGNSSC